MKKKKKSFVYKFSIIIFTFSFVLVAYSLFKIYKNESKATETLALWDELNDISIDDVDTNPSLNSEPSSQSNDSTNNNSTQSISQKNIPSDVNLIGKLTYVEDSVEVALIDGHTEKDLDYGAVHYYNTAYPGDEGNSLILGHRDGVFRFLKNIEIGDTIIIETKEKKSTYIIQETKITEPNDPIFYKDYNYPALTLLTCYPFYYIGSAPKRFIAIGKLVEN
ncbi:class D sortase [Clostridium sp. DL1XJH146]